MQAKVGDRIVIKNHHVGESDHVGEVMEVRGAEGGPPYVVRWRDSGHEALFYPGADARIESEEHATNH